MMKNIVARDVAIPQEHLDKLVGKIEEISGLDIDVIDVESATDLEKIPRELRYGSLVALASSKSFQIFGQKFPNSTLLVDSSDTSDESIEKTAKQAKWILTNFGKERSMNANTWFTSDTHFWHENIIKYCNRPYKTVEEMNEDLIAKWNARVGKDDIVWNLGDFCFGGKDKIESVFPRLNGRINLVLGNHDHHKLSYYYDLGFNRVYDHPVLISNFFILSHEPVQWIKDGDVYASIYGHVHNQEMYKDATSNTFCACVERTGYAPVSWTEMLEKMKEAASKSSSK